MMSSAKRGISYLSVMLLSAILFCGLMTFSIAEAVDPGMFDEKIDSKGFSKELKELVDTYKRSGSREAISFARTAGILIRDNYIPIAVRFTEDISSRDMAKACNKFFDLNGESGYCERYFNNIRHYVFLHILVPIAIFENASFVDDPGIGSIVVSKEMKENLLSANDHASSWEYAMNKWQEYEKRYLNNMNPPGALIRTINNPFDLSLANKLFPNLRFFQSRIAGAQVLLMFALDKNGTIMDIGGDFVAEGDDRVFRNIQYSVFLRSQKKIVSNEAEAIEIAAMTRAFCTPYEQGTDYKLSKTHYWAYREKGIWVVHTPGSFCGESAMAGPTYEIETGSKNIVREIRQPLGSAYGQEKE
jgi:hypothetical protein